MGVLEAVGVEESIATNVFLCTVMTASAVRVPLRIPAQEADNVPVVRTAGSGLEVTVADPAGIKVWVGTVVIVCDGAREGVEVQAREAVGSVFGEII